MFIVIFVSLLAAEKPCESISLSVYAKMYEANFQGLYDRPTQWPCRQNKSINPNPQVFVFREAKINLSQLTNFSVFWVYIGY